MMSKQRGLVAACIAPSLAAAGLVLAADAVRTRSTDLTVTEAIFLRNAGEADARLAAAGVPARQPVRHGAPLGGLPPMTPLEAAVRSGEPRMIELMLYHGAALDRESGLPLACLAERIGEHEIAAWLGHRLQITVSCD